MLGHFNFSSYLIAIFRTGSSNSSLSAQSASSYYRAMSHYMQTDPNSASIYPYHSLYSGNPASLTAGTNSSTGGAGAGKF